jgi:hypothetical protein
LHSSRTSKNIRFSRRTVRYFGNAEIADLLSKQKKLLTLALLAYTLNHILKYRRQTSKKDYKSQL